MTTKAVFERVRRCGRCAGSGKTMGAAMRIWCEDCDGVGYLESSTGHPADSHLLAGELNRLLEIMASGAHPVRGRHLPNTKGPGGSKFVGD